MRLFKLIPYMLAISIAFYALPILITNTGIAMFVMIFGLPIITFLLATCYGVRLGFNPWLPFVTAILFAPSIFIFYNSSAWVYIIVYAIIGLLGNLFGRLFYKFG